ncbi:hypothetical protein SDC9_82433 [bioreactor metagenome]|uniref:Uncharacterized protein n=1 Tax=bioreactor metagenome TaxID=1076179 RepID=A0A644Z5I2_9ZZZZ
MGLQNLDDSFRFFTLRFEFDSGIAIFGIFPEDDHIGFFRFFQWCRNAFEITDRTQANEKVQCLAQSDIQGTDPSADRCRQRSFDGHQMFTDDIHGLIRQPRTGQIKSFSSCKHFFPDYFTGIAIGFLNCGFEYFFGCLPNFRTDAIPFDERDDRKIRCMQTCFIHNNFFAKCHCALPPIVSFSDKGMYVRLTGPTYFERGRINVASRFCSNTCPNHPETRLIENNSVKRSCSIPKQ